MDERPALEIASSRLESFVAGPFAVEITGALPAPGSCKLIANVTSSDESDVIEVARVLRVDGKLLEFPAGGSAGFVTANAADRSVKSPLGGRDVTVVKFAWEGPVPTTFSLTLIARELAKLNGAPTVEFTADCTEPVALAGAGSAEVILSSLADPNSGAGANAVLVGGATAAKHFEKKFDSERVAMFFFAGEDAQARGTIRTPDERVIELAATPPGESSVAEEGPSGSYVLDMTAARRGTPGWLWAALAGLDPIPLDCFDPAGSHTLPASACFIQSFRDDLR